MAKTMMLLGTIILISVVLGSGEVAAQEEILDEAASWFDWFVDSVFDVAGDLSDWVWDFVDDWL